MARAEQILEIVGFTAPEMALQKVQQYLDYCETEEWNEIVQDAPPHFDGDEGIQAIAVRYVRDLERLRDAVSELLDGDGVGGPVESLLRLRKAYLEHLGRFEEAAAGVQPRA